MLQEGYVFNDVSVSIVFLHGAAIATALETAQEVREAYSEDGLGMANLYKLPKIKRWGLSAWNV